MNFEVLEHTADIGFRAWGPAFENMLAAAAQALVSIAVEIGTVRDAEPYPIAAKGEDRESLLVNWLNEVLYYVDGRQVAFRRFDVKSCGEWQVSGIGWGEPRSEAHPAKLIVKGVTYHQLSVTNCAEGWQCTVFLDI
ncbi:MAG: archease [Bryobacterales bacterium]|nr:archease [Bryobacterales bacterium]